MAAVFEDVEADFAGTVFEAFFADALVCTGFLLFKDEVFDAFFSADFTVDFVPDFAELFEAFFAPDFAVLFAAGLAVDFTAGLAAAFAGFAAVFFVFTGCFAFAADFIDFFEVVVFAIFSGV